MTKSETTQDGTVKNSRRLVRRGLWSLLWLGVVLSLSSTAHAQVTKLTALDGEEGDAFGFSVSLSGGRALVGAYQDDNKTGSAYLFKSGRSTWTQEVKLTASDAFVGDWFGVAASLDGERAVVGANLHDGVGSASGAAYVFEFDGTSWGEVARLTASDAASDDRFGGAISLDGDRVLIGARGDADEGSDTGAAYIFDFDGTTWNQTAKLTASDAAARDRFGVSVSLDGDLAIIGASLNDDLGSGSGSAYIFRFDGTSWVEEAKLTASDGAATDRFGASVSLSGGRVLIGAFGHIAEAGAAYIFRFDGTAWVEEDRLSASDAATGDNFGAAVALDGDEALIGAWGNADAGLVTGSAYIFDFNGTTWVQQDKFIADAAAAGDGFGITVSLDGEGMLVGALSGAAYVYGPFVPVAIDDEAAVPDAYRLYANYPNPFNPSTEIRFDLPKAAHATLVIYDLMGREVTRLVDRPLPAGTHAVTWQAEGLSSGTYIYRLTAGAYSQARSMVLFR